jgi:hypothetical protein
MFLCILLWLCVNIRIKFRLAQHRTFYYTILWLHVSAFLSHL